MGQSKSDVPLIASRNTLAGRSFGIGPLFYPAGRTLGDGRRGAIIRPRGKAKGPRPARGTTPRCLRRRTVGLRLAWPGAVRASGRHDAERAGALKLERVCGWTRCASGGRMGGAGAAAPAEGRPHVLQGYLDRDTHS